MTLRARFQLSLRQPFMWADDAVKQFELATGVVCVIKNQDLEVMTLVRWPRQTDELYWHERLKPRRIPERQFRRNPVRRK